MRAEATHSGTRRRVVLFQLATIAVLLGNAGLIAASASAETVTIGRTWPIAEPDALAEIEGRAARQPASIAGKFGPRGQWSAMQAAPLGVAQADRVRNVVPFYTLETEIRLPDGKLLYPRGFTFNPLSYVSLPQRLVIVRPRDLGWALRTAHTTDFILLAAGDSAGPDVIALSEKIGRPIHLLEPRIKDRLGLTVAPVIVAQTGQKLVLTEVAQHPAGSTR